MRDALDDETAAIIRQDKSVGKKQKAMFTARLESMYKAFLSGPLQGFDKTLNDRITAVKKGKRNLENAPAWLSTPSSKRLLRGEYEMGSEMKPKKLRWALFNDSDQRADQVEAPKKSPPKPPTPQRQKKDKATDESKLGGDSDDSDPEFDHSGTQTTPPTHAGQTPRRRCRRLPRPPRCTASAAPRPPTPASPLKGVYDVDARRVIALRLLKGLHHFRNHCAQGLLLEREELLLEDLLVQLGHRDEDPAHSLPRLPKEHACLPEGDTSPEEREPDGYSIRPAHNEAALALLLALAAPARLAPRSPRVRRPSGRGSCCRRRFLYAEVAVNPPYVLERVARIEKLHMCLQELGGIKVDEVGQAGVGAINGSDPSFHSSAALRRFAARGRH